MTTPGPCAVCSGRTFVVVRRDDGGGTRADPCPECRGRNPVKRLLAAGVPEADLTRALEPVDRQVADQTEKALALADSGLADSMLLCGPVGAGKTVLAYRLLLRVAERQPALRLGYTFLPTLFLQIKDTFGRAGRRSEDETEWSILKPLISPDVALLDDLGAEYVSEWAVAIVGVLVHERYAAGKRTLVTTNLALEVPEGDACPSCGSKRMPCPRHGVPPNLRDLYGDRIGSRLRTYRHVVMEGPADLREKYRLRGGTR